MPDTDSDHRADTVRLPSVEAVEYGRRVLGHEVERLRKFERDADERGDEGAAERWRHLARWIEWQILGTGEGCVIRYFDPRWTDPEWRRWYAQTGSPPQLEAER